MSLNEPSDPPGDGAGESEPYLSGGELLTAISNRIVGLLAEHYGRGPIRAKTYVLDDLVVCVLRNGFTAIEETMMRTGHPDRVVEMRREFQVMMDRAYKDSIEELTGSRVVALLSQAHIEPDITIELFLVEPALPGFGTAEIGIPHRIDDH
jgi:uncharacterized protein YbcI